MPKVLRLPKRSEVKADDTWDLVAAVRNRRSVGKLFRSSTNKSPAMRSFAASWAKGAKTLRRLPEIRSRLRSSGRAVGGYAHLKMTEDQADSTYQAMVARFQNLATRASQSASYIRPEILCAAQEEARSNIWRLRKSAVPLGTGADHPL